MFDRKASATAHTIDVTITIDTVPTCLIVGVACIPMSLVIPGGLPTGENPIQDIGSY